MSERWKLPPRVQATAMPTEQEIRIMEVHMFGRELEDHDRPERYRNRQTLPPPATVPCSLSNWEKAPDAGEQAVAFVRAAVAANRGVDLDVLRAFLKEYDAPQPAPSVPAGADVAAVLARLLLLMEQQRWWSGDDETKWSTWDKAMRMVQHEVDRQAATEARAAGGEMFALREAAEQARWNIRHCEGSTSLEYERHWRATAVWLEKRAAAIERGETPDKGTNEPAAPPAPSAHGVAELLAECRDLIERRGDVGAVISCDQIVRLLTPGGADGGET